LVKIGGEVRVGGMWRRRWWWWWMTVVVGGWRGTETRRKGGRWHVLFCLWGCVVCNVGFLIGFKIGFYYIILYLVIGGMKRRKRIQEKEVWSVNCDLLNGLGFYGCGRGNPVRGRKTVYVSDPFLYFVVVMTYSIVAGCICTMVVKDWLWNLGMNFLLSTTKVFNWPNYLLPLSC